MQLTDASIISLKRLSSISKTPLTNSLAQRKARDAIVDFADVAHHHPDSHKLSQIVHHYAPYLLIIGLLFTGGYALQAMLMPIYWQLGGTTLAFAAVLGTAGLVIALCGYHTKQMITRATKSFPIFPTSPFSSDKELTQVLHNMNHVVWQRHYLYSTINVTAAYALLLVSLRLGLAMVQPLTTVGVVLPIAVGLAIAGAMLVNYLAMRAMRSVLQKRVNYAKKAHHVLHRSLDRIRNNVTRLQRRDKVEVVSTENTKSKPEHQKLLNVRATTNNKPSNMISGTSESVNAAVSVGGHQSINYSVVGEAPPGLNVLSSKAHAVLASTLNNHDAIEQSPSMGAAVVSNAEDSMDNSVNPSVVDASQIAVDTNDVVTPSSKQRCDSSTLTNRPSSDDLQSVWTEARTPAPNHNRSDSSHKTPEFLSTVSSGACEGRKSPVDVVRALSASSNSTPTVEGQVAVLKINDQKNKNGKKKGRRNKSKTGGLRSIFGINSNNRGVNP